MDNTQGLNEKNLYHVRIMTGIVKPIAIGVLLVISELHISSEHEEKLETNTEGRTLGIYREQYHRGMVHYMQYLGPKNVKIMIPKTGRSCIVTIKKLKKMFKVHICLGNPGKVM